MRLTDADLRQTTIYTSESRGRLMVTEMNPGHALSAWRRLREEAGDDWDPVVKRSPLAGALLEQALGDTMLFAGDQAPAPLFLEDGAGGYDVLVQRCYDGLMTLQQQGPVHIIEQAKIIARAINPQGER